MLLAKKRELEPRAETISRYQTEKVVVVSGHGSCFVTLWQLLPM